MLGAVFCVGRGLAAETSTNASVLTIAAFTVERYIGICHPIRSKTMSSLGRVFRIIAALWMVACLGAIPQAIQYGIQDKECKVLIFIRLTFNKWLLRLFEICRSKTCFLPYTWQVVRAINYTFEISTFLFFITPMTIITVVYVKIGLELYKAGPQGLPAGPSSAERNRSVVRMLGEDLCNLRCCNNLG